MERRIINDYEINKRNDWIKKISQLSGDFKDSSNEIEKEIESEIQKEGNKSLIAHLRFCSVIPERYKHDSGEEKLYSKYTEIVVAQAFKRIGFTTIVFNERGDAADVGCTTKSYSFVADAKAFRLSRTAKNQKDFKVSSVNSWKKSNTYSMIVAPIYQLPSRTSQVYQQASSNTVCIFTYMHLSVLVRYHDKVQVEGKAISLLKGIFETIVSLNPSKDANNYWTAINQYILNFDEIIRDIWLEEKQATVESVSLAKNEAIEFFNKERMRIMNLSKEEAIKEVLELNKLDKKISMINSINMKRVALFMKGK